MAKVLFVEARKKLTDIKLSELDNLPGGSISLSATIQYLNFIEPIKEYLESKGRSVFVKNGAYYKGHVLGCNPFAFDKSKDVFLLLCDGKFHALNNAIILDKQIYVFDTNKLDSVSEKDLEVYRKKKISKQMKFLQEEKIGLIISTKPGQRCLSKEKILTKLKSLGKTIYLFETDNVDFNEFDNFKNIKIWVNTACFGLALDDPRILNFSDILEFL